MRRSTEGKLEVRLTRSAMKFGMNYFNPGTARSEIHIQLYSYRLSGESRPMFSLSPQDGEWFDCYADQAEGLWKNAQAYDFDAAADEAA
ncbi:hypothetical protein [Actinomycetospora sp. CA-084318]|uniref:hypothetical protein n=1 Tax=Actinomycetospora sp. CA-084318 TaxID=3239892 RepID=UPI003D965689